jgi:hypothetical protein
MDACYARAASLERGCRDAEEQIVRLRRRKDDLEGALSQLEGRKRRFDDSATSAARAARCVSEESALRAAVGYAEAIRCACGDCAAGGRADAGIAAMLSRAKAGIRALDDEIAALRRQADADMRQASALRLQAASLAGAL